MVQISVFADDTVKHKTSPPCVLRAGTFYEVSLTEGQKLLRRFQEEEILLAVPAQAFSSEGGKDLWTGYLNEETLLADLSPAFV